MKELAEFWDGAGSPLVKIPVIGGTELNLHLLHTLVSRLGGYERVCKDRRWMEVTAEMSIHSATAQHVSGALKKHYQQLLLPFDQRSARGEVGGCEGEDASRVSAVGGLILRVVLSGLTSRSQTAPTPREWT